MPASAATQPERMPGIQRRPDGHRLLNLGCGEKTHPAFVNVDLNSGPGIVQYDLRSGIPFADASFDLVYHSTMLSMLRPLEAERLTAECVRVLKPGGVLRIVTEDLEQICREYLVKLEHACSGDLASGTDHDWMILELYDQATREWPGGQMLAYLSQDPLTNEDFIRSRVGEQGRTMIAGARARLRQPEATVSKGLRGTLSRLKTAWQRMFLRVFLGADGARAFDVGTFRLSSGQVSYRMYDRYSLKQLLLRAGLSRVSLTTAGLSEYPYWDEVNLDAAPDGRPARPHALIMEGARLER